ncbi:hypothetical protein C8R43DRAFT_942644 [Mycena crocata]|nr:hypothetical protein C8R43DRAFT_942644 [Mycena crocata]
MLSFLDFAAECVLYVSIRILTLKASRAAEFRANPKCMTSAFQPPSRTKDNWIPVPRNIPTASIFLIKFRAQHPAAELASQARLVFNLVLAVFVAADTPNRLLINRATIKPIEVVDFYSVPAKVAAQHRPEFLICNPFLTDAKFILCMTIQRCNFGRCAAEEIISMVDICPVKSVRGSVQKLRLGGYSVGQKEIFFLDPRGFGHT